LEKRQKIFTNTKNTIDGMYAGIQHDYDVMTMTLPEEKKDFVKKEVKAVSEKLEVVGRFKEKVDKIDTFVTDLKSFDITLKEIDAWMRDAETHLGEIKNNAGAMTPEDRVSNCMELEEDYLPKLMSSRKTLPLKKNFFHKEKKYLKMPKITKMNSRESLTLFPTCTKKS
jgi:hypothetical protein